MPSLFSIPPRSRCGSCWPWPSSSCAPSAGSVYLTRKHQAADGDVLPDAVFWDGFAGLAVVGAGRDPPRPGRPRGRA